MKKIISIMAIAMVIGGANVAALQAGEVTEKRDLSSFDNIIIDDAGVSIDVEVGKDYSITLKGAEKWIKRIVMTVRDDALVISMTEKKKKKINWNSDNKIMITLPQFTGLKVEGAVDADIMGIDSEKVNFELDGAGNIVVRGKCGSLKVEIDGAGNFEGRQLECENVKVDIDGAGNVEAYGSQSADLDISGFGNIDLYGNPKNVKKDKGLFSNITIHK